MKERQSAGREFCITTELIIWQKVKLKHSEEALTDESMTDWNSKKFLALRPQSIWYFALTLVLQNEKCIGAFSSFRVLYTQAIKQNEIGRHTEIRSYDLLMDERLLSKLEVRLKPFRCSQKIEFVRLSAKKLVCLVFVLLCFRQVLMDQEISFCSDTERPTLSF